LSKYIFEKSFKNFLLIKLNTNIKSNQKAGELLLFLF